MDQFSFMDVSFLVNGMFTSLISLIIAELLSRGLLLIWMEMSIAQTDCSLTLYSIWNLRTTS